MAKPKLKALADPAMLEQLEKLTGRVETNSQIMDNVVNQIVSEYCKALDEYMEEVSDKLTDPVNPPLIHELDEIVMALPVYLYFVGEGQESIGIREDVAKAIRMEVYNEAYESAETGKRTIADKTAAAELAAQEELLIQMAYNRAYKKIKIKMEIGNELLQSVKKVLSRRISELEMAKFTPEGRSR